MGLVTPEVASRGLSLVPTVSLALLPVMLIQVHRYLLTFSYLNALPRLNTTTLSGGSTDPDYTTGVGTGEMMMSALSHKLRHHMFALLHRKTGQEKYFHGIISWW